MKRNIEAMVEAMVAPIMAEHDFECVDVAYEKEAGTWYLRVYVDKEGGITIDDCETVSRALDALLDAADPIEEAYILEVSSPGLDRPLKKEKDYVRSVGKLVEAKLYQPIDGSKVHVGELVAYDADTVTLLIEEHNLVLSRKGIALIRLAVIF